MTWVLLLDEPAPLGVNYRLETIVGAELLVDAVEVVAERLRGNPQPAGDGHGVVAFGEQPEDPTLLVGERLDRGVAGVVGERNDVTGDVHHAIEQLLVAPPLGFPPGSTTLARLSAAFLTSVVERVVAATDRHEGDFSLLKPLRLSERQYRQMTGELLGVVNRYSFVSEGAAIAKDEDDRPEWQLAIAASRADPTNDPEAALRNLKPDEVA